MVDYFFSAFIGSFSHVLLASIMHTDLELFYPITLINNFQGFIIIEALHILCLYSSLVGTAYITALVGVSLKLNEHSYAKVNIYCK
jgi:membrane-bound metal-dependent hydrolase YbcI (DUF457 family)